MIYYFMSIEKYAMDLKNIDFEKYYFGTNLFYDKQLVESFPIRFPEGKINFQEKPGKDPRNYRVNFEKVKNILGFTPSFSIDRGIEEIIAGLKDDLFNVEENKNFYGNYEINL